LSSQVPPLLAVLHHLVLAPQSLSDPQGPQVVAVVQNPLLHGADGCAHAPVGSQPPIWIMLPAEQLALPHVVLVGAD
jgi:hypothetical protein